MPSTLPKKLAHISGGAASGKATIVVGGIHDTYKHFATWEKELSQDGSMLLGFDHDHMTSSMTDSSKELAQALRDLHEQGIDDVTIVAHSMGGLVSKAAINELARTGDAQSFENIDFHALGTPWGGFAVASLPFTETLAPLAGYPMGGEMAPNSAFMQKLSAQPLPENVHISIYQGTADSVSLPGSQMTADRFNANIAQAKAYVSIEGYGHTDYVHAGVNVLQAGHGREVPGFDSVEPPRAASDLNYGEATASAESGSRRGAPAPADAAPDMDAPAGDKRLAPPEPTPEAEAEVDAEPEFGMD